jgi:hypothetical protein
MRDCRREHGPVHSSNSARSPVRIMSALGNITVANLQAFHLDEQAPVSL